MLQRANKLVGEVQELLVCTEDEALLLLANFRWSPRELEERVFAGGRDAAGVSDRPDPPALQPPSDGTFFDAVLLDTVRYGDAGA